MGILAEGLEEMKPISAGSLGSDVDGIEIAGGHLLGDLTDEVLEAREVVLHSKTWGNLLAPYTRGCPMARQPHSKNSITDSVSSGESQDRGLASQEILDEAMARLTQGMDLSRPDGARYGLLRVIKTNPTTA